MCRYRNSLVIFVIIVCTFLFLIPGEKTGADNGKGFKVCLDGQDYNRIVDGGLSDCCSKELARIMPALKGTPLAGYNIFIMVANNEFGRQFSTASSRSCPEPKLELFGLRCAEIYITVKAKPHLNEDELIAIIGHELGHIAEPSDTPEKYKEDRADDFSIKLLKKMKINSLILPEALEKMGFMKEICGQQFMEYNRQRIEKLKRRFSKNK